MSTRAQIILKDAYGALWFYRHSDGYPSGTLPTLNLFLEWVKSGRIRDNVSQAAGWLVLIGHTEYAKDGAKAYEPNDANPGMGWKVGAYEPCEPIQHGDIEFLYTVDLAKRTVSVREV
jgi:hypothetical protein